MLHSYMYTVIVFTHKIPVVTVRTINLSYVRAPLVLVYMYCTEKLFWTLVYVLFWF